MKSGIVLDIPGAGRREIRVLVSDYTGTLSCGGSLAPGVRERLLALDGCLDLHVVTSDTFGTAAAQLAGIPCVLRRLESDNHSARKREYLLGLADPRHAAALGNGSNDALLLEAVRDGGGLAIAVDNGEGCSAAALRNAEIVIAGAANALDLLLDPRRLVATLRV